jgi:hypothetical protein
MNAESTERQYLPANRPNRHSVVRSALAMVDANIEAET